MKTPNSEEKLFIEQNIDSDTTKLLLGKHQDIDIKFCVRQIEGLKKAKEKFSSLLNDTFLLFPPKLNLEQTSSEQTAKYKTSLFKKEKSIADLTGGLGIDTIFFAKHFKQVYYFEQNKELFDIAKYNFNELGLSNIHAYSGNSIELLNNLNKVDIIYLDPARRDENKNKVFLIKDCEPNVIDLIPILLEKADTICFKLSPMLDINFAIKDLKFVSEVHVISVKNECKELFFILKQEEIKNIKFNCVDFDSNDNINTFSFLDIEEQNSVPKFANEVKKYLYEPNTSVLKASGFKIIGEKFGLEKIGLSSHLYTSNDLVDNFSGRKFEVIKTISTNSKSLKELQKEYPKANVTIRNFPESVADIRKRTKIKEGGDIYLFFTTNNSNEKIVVCCKKI